MSRSVLGRSSEARVMVALALFGVLGSLFLVSQHLRSFGTSVIGLGGDPYQTLWRFEVLADALLKGSLSALGEPFRNLGPLPWMPLHLLLGEPWAYNVVWILQAPLAAVATAVLGRLLGLRIFPAALAGVLVAFAPYRLAQSLGHFGAMQLFWIPATLAAFLALMRSPSYSRSLLLGSLLIGLAWTEHTLFLTGVVGLLILSFSFRSALALVLQKKSARRLALFVAALAFAGAVLPFVQELRATASSASRLNPGTDQRLRFTPTLSSLMSAPSFHAFRGASPSYGTPRSVAADHIHSLGVVALFVALAGVVFKRREWSQTTVRFLLLLAAAGLLLAVLPRAPAGALLYDRLPILSAVRAVDRFLVLPVLALPLLAASTLQRMPRGIAVFTTLLLLLEILPSPSFPVQNARINAGYARLGGMGRGTILDIPGATDYVVASKALYASLAHGLTPLGGIAFERVDDPKARKSLLRVPVLRDLLLVRTADLDRSTFFGQEPKRIALAALASENVAAVVLHRTVNGLPVLGIGPRGAERLEPEDVSRVGTFLSAVGLSEVYSDAELSVYRVPPWPGDQSEVLVSRGRDWHRVSRRADGTIQAALGRKPELEVKVLGALELPLELNFRVADGSAPGTARTMHFPTPQTIRLMPGTLVRIPLGTLSPGRHAFSLDVDAGGPIVENPTVRLTGSP